MGHTIQPAAYGFAFANRLAFADENQKRGLKSIFGIVQVEQHAPAQAPHQRTVSLQQGGEGGLIVAQSEALQKDAIAQVRRGERASKPPNVAEDRA